MCAKSCAKLNLRLDAPPNMPSRNLLACRLRPISDAGNDHLTMVPDIRRTITVSRKPCRFMASGADNTRCVTLLAQSNGRSPDRSRMRDLAS